MGEIPPKKGERESPFRIEGAFSFLHGAILPLPLGKSATREDIHPLRQEKHDALFARMNYPLGYALPWRRVRPQGEDV